MRDLSATTGARAVGGLAAALLVVGAGAAIGLPTNHGRHPTGTATPPTIGPGGPSASATTAGTIASHGTAGSTTTLSTSVSAAGSGPSTPPTTPARTSSASGGRGSDASTSSTTRVRASSPPGTPPTGTYTYATSGSQTLFSKTSSYPPSTTIDVTPSGCGVSAQWTSSPGNSTTVVECPVAHGIHVVSENSSVDENGYRNSMTFTCDSDSFVPTSGSPGRTWTWSCSAPNGETTQQVVKLIGPATMTVAGAPVPTVHVQVLSTLSGPEKGKVTSDYWLTPDAVPVHEVGSIQASEFGITYTSNYTLQLDSLTPSH